MPKKLDCVREKAIARTRLVLQTGGYDALAMRSIAAACGIAVGTMYNYFPSKEYLTGCVVLEDWQVCYRDMELLAGSADSMVRGVAGIYEKMLRFVEEHQYLTAFDIRKAQYADRHLLLRGQMEALLQMLQARLGCPLAPEITEFLAESILNSTAKRYEYRQVAPAFAKLLN